MSRKSKGTDAERELIHLFHSIEGWSAVRVAGSGSNRYPSPDIIAGNNKRHIAIECKSTRSDKKYIDKEDIEQLRAFSVRFGAEMFVGVRFTNSPWYFLRPNELEDIGKSAAISRTHAQKKGILFNDLIAHAVLPDTAASMEEEE